MLHVIEFLKDHTFRQLEIEHGVNVRRDSANTKFSLNYDTIFSSPGNKLAEQCRGTVLRPKNYSFLSSENWYDEIVGDCEILSWPMNRFYNEGEFYAAQVDWADPFLFVMEKLDGTMIGLYWDSLKNAWSVSTRSVSEADLPINNLSIEIPITTTFSDLFWQGLKNSCENFSLNLLNKNFTYVFELTSKFNRVVVLYDKPAVTLLALRNLHSGMEVSTYDAPKSLYGIPRPKRWQLNTAADVSAFVNSQNPTEYEGVVVCDSKFNRIKIKSMAYVLSSKSKAAIESSPRAVLLAIISGTIDDVIPLVNKETASKFEMIRHNLKNYLLSLDEQFVEMKTMANDSKKEFALMVMKKGIWSGPMFSLWNNQAKTVQELLELQAHAGKLSNSTLDFLLSKIV
jgi:hypothetical protein